MENSCREEGELSEDENEDVVITYGRLEPVVKATAKEEIIVIEDDDDKGSGLNAHSAPVRHRPLTALNSHARNNETKKCPLDKAEIHRKKHKKTGDSKYRHAKHRGEVGTRMAKRSEKIKNNQYGRKKSQVDDTYSKTSHKNIYGQSGFMDKMRGRYMYQGSGTLGDLLKARSTSKQTQKVSEIPPIPSEESLKDLKESELVCGVENETISLSDSSLEKQIKLSPKKTNEVNSPLLDDDQEYAHLLLEYKEVKEKLEELQQEEKSLFELKPGTGEVVLEGVAVGHMDDISTVKDKTEVVDMELASSEDEVGQITNIMQKEPVEDEDDDIDLLELRLAALESAARAKKSAFEKEESDMSSSKEKRVVKKSATKTGKRRERSQRRNSVSRLLQLEEDRLYREREHMWREKRRIRQMQADLMYEREMIERWHQKHLKEDVWMGEIQRILSTEDKDTRYHRVLELFRLEDMAVQSSLARSKSNQTESLSRRNVPRSERGLSPGQLEYYQTNRSAESDPQSVAPKLAEEGIVEKKGSDQQTSAGDIDRSEQVEVVLAQQITSSAETSKSSEEEEEEDMLRARLLASVAKRRRQRELEQCNTQQADVVTAETDTLIQQGQEGGALEGSNAALSQGDTGEGDHTLTQQEQGKGNTSAPIQEEGRGELSTLIQQQDKRKRQVNTLIQEQKQAQAFLSGQTSKRKPDTSEISSDIYRKSIQPLHSVLAIPKHKPVIIDLEADSSDESDGEPSAKQTRMSGETQTGSFIGSLDSFLKAARKSVERRTHHPASVSIKPEPPTPDALKRLGSHKVQEYRMLKEEIRKRERKRGGRGKPEQVDLVVTVSDDQNRLTREVVLQGQESEQSQSEKEVLSQDEGHEPMERSILEVRPGELGVEVKQLPLLPGVVETQAKQQPLVPGVVGTQAKQHPLLPGVVETQAKQPLLPGVVETQAKQHPLLPGVVETQAKQPLPHSSAVGIQVKQQPQSGVVETQAKQQPPQPSVVETQAKQLKQLKLKAALQRGLIDQEKQQIQKIRHFINKKKAVVKLAEQKIQKMKEQMMATQTVLKANLDQISRLNQDAQHVQGKMDARREKLVLLEKELQDLVTSSSKRLYNQKDQVGRVEFNKTQSPMRESDQTTNSPLCVVDADQLDEKMRLVQLEQKYAAIIKSYKDSQGLVEKDAVSSDKEKTAASKEEEGKKGKRRTCWGFGSRLGTPLRPKALEHVETEETMAVNECEEESQDSLSVVRKKRRSSLYSTSDSGPVTQPQLSTESTTKSGGWGGDSNIKPLVSEVTLTSGKGSSVSRESSPLASSTTLTFTSPTGQHLVNLKRLHMENLTNPNIVSFTSETDTAMQSKTVISELKYHPKISSDAALFVKMGRFRAYRSPLLKFKSYRLSPYFRTKSGLKLTSVTYNSQVVPSKLLCRYDLMGKCNDDHCSWQHESDYKLEGEEILQDLVAYTPQLAGISDAMSPDMYSLLIGKYAEQFSKQNQKMTLDQQCILLSSEVNTKAKHTVPHTMHHEARKWKPKSSLTRRSSIEMDHNNPDCDSVSTECKPSSQQAKASAGRSSDGDDILCEEDVRYWMLSAEEIQDMESSVVENPTQIPLWIRLAYKKLHADDGGEDGVNHALNILSRALEANRDSPDLWLHYLAVYRQKHDLTDLYHLHKQAILFAPCYQLFWKFLKLQPSYRKKIQLCSDIEKFLCQENPSDINSHRLLEVTLYKIQLMVLTGRIKTAKYILKDTLSVHNVVHQLTQTDLVLAWLAYIHLSELHMLPPHLFSSTDSNPGKLVNKTPVIIDSSSGKFAKLWGYTNTCSLLQDALAACAQTTTISTTSPGHPVQHTTTSQRELALLPLYQNAIHLHLTYERSTEARKMCNEILKDYSSLPEVWILCHDVELKQGNPCKAIELLEQSVRELSTEPLLQHTLATCYLADQNQDRALEVLELCPFHYFELPEEESEIKDPNVLYCILLKLPTPLKCELPVKKAGLTEDHIRAGLPYLWLNYCQLLELQGCTELEVTEAYETALSSLSSTKAVKLLWKSYLYYALLQVQSSAKPCQSGEFSNKKWCDLVHRCLLSVPLKVTLPCDQYYIDYEFHNQVIDMTLGCVNSSQHSLVYEDCLRLLPTDVHLVIRACQHFYKEGEITRALGTCAVVFDRLCSSLPLCKMYLSLMYQSGNMKEVQKVYSIATQKLPYCIWLWKNYLLFEATWGKGDRMRQLLQQCRDLEVNIDEFRSTVLRC